VRGKFGWQVTDAMARSLVMISAGKCTAALAMALGFVAQAMAAGSPTADLSRWVVEQMPGGTVTVRDGALEIRDKAGCTIWWKEKLTAPVEVEFTVTAIHGPSPSDRVSDVNCFWMAQENGSEDAPFSKGHARTGRFAEYDSLFTYYVGYGANNNTTTRFRRYDGTASRPLLPEHDLRDSRFMLTAGRPVRIRLVARDGMAEYWRDGERILHFKDPHPLEWGWFAFRTVKSHLRITDFLVVQGAKDAAEATSTPAVLPQRGAGAR